MNDHVSHLRTFNYTEQCVTLTSDFSTIFGNEYDTVAPSILSIWARLVNLKVWQHDGCHIDLSCIRWY